MWFFTKDRICWVYLLQFVIVWGEYCANPNHLEDLKHWVLAKLDLLNWIIVVCDSLNFEGLSNDKIQEALEFMSKFIPMLDERISLFEFKSRKPLRTYPIPVTIMQDIPRQENEWVNVFIMCSFDFLNGDNNMVCDFFSFVNRETGVTVVFLPLKMLNAW